MPLMALVNAFDSTNYPTCEPAQLTAGRRWAWRRDDILSVYPAASYSWAWKARPESAVSQTATAITISGSASGTAILFESGISATKLIAPGRYVWDLVVTRTSDSETVTVDSGTTTVLPDPATDTADRRAFARVALTNVEAAIAGNTSPDVQSYSIAGRSLSRYSLAELMDLRDRLRRDISREDVAAAVSRGMTGAGIVRVAM